MGLFTPCFVPRGGVLCTVIVPGGGFCSFQVVSRGDGLDEIDTCITSLSAEKPPFSINNLAPTDPRLDEKPVQSIVYHRDH